MSRKKQLIINNLNVIHLSLFLFIILLISSNSYAETIEVGTGKKYSTIQQAANNTNPGDIIKVFPGRYGRVVINRGGSKDKILVFRSAHAPVVSFPDNSNAKLNNPSDVATTQGFNVNSNYVRIEGFEVTNISSGNEGAIYLNKADFVEIVNNYIHELDCDSNQWGAIRGYGNNIKFKNNVLWRVEGISIFILGQNWIVENNDLSHGSNLRKSDRRRVSGDADAFRFFGSGHVIRNNYIHHYLLSETDGRPHMDCFQTYSVNGYAYDIIIEQNYCYNIGAQMFMGEDQSEKRGGENKVHHITFRNNIFQKVGAAAINVHNVDYLTFVNNVVADAGYGPLWLRDGSHHATILNNIFYNNGGDVRMDESSSKGSVWDYNLYSPSSKWYEKHGPIGNPKFVNPKRGDFHLKKDSPAVDSGTDISNYGVTVDKDNNKRPQGDGWDIGAFEFKPVQ